jgi:hypothetical protein
MNHPLQVTHRDDRVHQSDGHSYATLFVRPMQSHVDEVYNLIQVDSKTWDLQDSALMARPADRLPTHCALN